VVRPFRRRTQRHWLPGHAVSWHPRDARADREVHPHQHHTGL